jgi:hypothetical protein
LMSIATNLQLMHYQIIVLQLIDFCNGTILQLEFNYCNFELQLINLLMELFCN